MSSPSLYLQKLHGLFRANANPADAVFMKRYMKDQFEFYGIKTPQRQALSRQLIAAEGVPAPGVLPELCRLCFQAEQREVQYFVNDLLQPLVKRLDPSFLDVISELIGMKSWWDTIDFLSPKLAGPLLLRHPDLIPDYPGRWIESDNFWYRRAAMLFQLGYKKKTDAALLFGYISRCASSEEFFIRKGAGWALREYSKTDGHAVRAFVEQSEDLSPLTKKEALRRIDLTPDNGGRL